MMPPRFLFIETNKVCNLKCQHCFYWTHTAADEARGISKMRRKVIIAEFAELNPAGTVVTCGGESMLDLDGYFSLTRTARLFGLKCFSVVNGTQITDDRIAERMLLEGPTEITVSLNSHRAELHDRTRGVPGCFQQAVDALRLLLAARKRLGTNNRIYVMAVIMEQNYRELDAFYDFVLNDIGADKLKLNFLQPSFGSPRQMGRDKFYAGNLITDTSALEREIRACDRKYGLGINPSWLRDVLMYHESVKRNADAVLGWSGQAGTQRPICNTYERNIMVDLEGTARLCFSTAFPGAQLRVRGDLRRFWEGADDIRDSMRDCRRYCGISHSVRRESATLPLPG